MFATCRFACQPNLYSGLVFARIRRNAEMHRTYFWFCILVFYRFTLLGGRVGYMLFNAFECSGSRKWLSIWNTKQIVFPLNLSTLCTFLFAHAFYFVFHIFFALFFRCARVCCPRCYDCRCIIGRIGWCTLSCECRSI